MPERNQNQWYETSKMLKTFDMLSNYENGPNLSDIEDQALSAKRLKNRIFRSLLLL